MALIFQYGSNTSEKRINSESRLNGIAIKKGIGRTVDKFEIDFTVLSKVNSCAAADLIPNGSKNIWGVLYEIPDNRVFRDRKEDNQKCLDQIEGEGFNYERINIIIEDELMKEIEAITYIALESKRRYDIKTSKKYVSHIITGLTESGINSEYIDYVKSQVNKNNPKIEL